MTRCKKCESAIPPGRTQCPFCKEPVQSVVQTPIQSKNQNDSLLAIGGKDILRKSDIQKTADSIKNIDVPIKINRINWKKTILILIVLGVVSVILFMVLGNNDSVGSGKRDFSSTIKIEEYFKKNLEKNYPTAYKISVSARNYNMLTARYKGSNIKGTFVNCVVVIKGVSNIQLQYFVTSDGKIFDASNMSSLVLLETVFIDVLTTYVGVK